MLPGREGESDPAEEQRVAPLESRLDLLPNLRVEIGPGEGLGCLHHAVERNEHVRNDLPHDNSSVSGRGMRRQKRRSMTKTRPGRKLFGRLRTHASRLAARRRSGLVAPERRCGPEFIAETEIT